MSKIAIIHTTAVTVEPLKKLVDRFIPGTEVINIVDDSTLPQLINNDGDLSLVEERLNIYINICSSLGVDLVLSACSSVGEVFEKANKEQDIPVLRIDNAMADLAVKKGDKIGVVATLATTLRPTIELLERKAKISGRSPEFKTELVSSAYQKLVLGDLDGHDRILAKSLKKLADEVDLVVLAQASMARVVETLSEDIKDKFITSPELGIKELKRILEGDS